MNYLIENISFDLKLFYPAKDDFVFLRTEKIDLNCAQSGQ
jgi:hypothetical protein